jgi:O-antigen/teichoic acid export membrane protein
MATETPSRALHDRETLNSQSLHLRANRLSTLTAGKVLARSALWNFAGQALPLIAALVALPILIRGLSIDRFGVLALAWMMIGYSSLFDFGIGRALTKIVAEKLGSGREDEIAAVAWTALLLMMLLGVCGAVAFAFLAPWLVTSVLRIPTKLQRESLDAFYVLTTSIPLVISTAALRGLLEAYQRFDLTNYIRGPLGVLTFVGPLLVLPFSTDLVPVVAVLVAARLLAWIAYLIVCLRVLPSAKRPLAIDRASVGPLFRFGGWMTVTNIVGPFMMYLDRFVIGAYISLAAVSYYVTPFEIVTKLSIVPAAIVGVLFPAFATALQRDRIRAENIFKRGVNFTFLSLFPITLLLVAFAPEILGAWLDTEFAVQSAPVLRWLAVGILINSIAQVPFAYLQGAGRPDLTAKLHLIELPLYLLLLTSLITTLGIVGVAIAWFLRALVDSVLLFFLTNRMMSSSDFPSRLSLGLAVAIGTLFAAAAVPGLLMRAGLVITILCVFIVGSWLIVLSPEDRMFIRNRVRFTRQRL